MSVIVELNKFQIFLCQFGGYITSSWAKLKKRHLLLPVFLSVKFNEFQPVAEFQGKLHTISKRKIGGVIHSIKIKATLIDTEILIQIGTYQMSMLGTEEEAVDESKTNQEKKNKTKRLQTHN